MVSEDKSDREPDRIRMPAVDRQHLRFAVAAADHGSFRRAADAPLLRQGPHPTDAPCGILKRNSFVREIDRDSSGSRNSKPGVQQSAGSQRRRLEGSANGGNA